MKKIVIFILVLCLPLMTYCQAKDKIFTSIVKFNQGVQFSDNTIQTTAGGVGSMVYPDSGIPLSTGSAWGVSITNNSTNWNTAYSWGNHAGLYRSIGYIPTFASITGKPTTLSGYGITDAALSTHLHTTLYKPLTYVPTWAEILGKPIFATVATTGSYNDLVDKPEVNLDVAISQLQGIKIPVLTATQISSISLVPGLLLYNSTDNVLQIYTGTQWKVLMTNQ